jgi:hypothetical protein
MQKAFIFQQGTAICVKEQFFVIPVQTGILQSLDTHPHEDNILKVLNVIATDKIGGI